MAGSRLKDIAQEVGVDLSTVSKVLRGCPVRVSAETRSRILAVSESLRYRPNTVAQGLRTRRSGAIAMAMPSTTNYLYPEIIRGAEEAAEERQYCLFLVKYGERDGGLSLIDLFEQGRIDGLLLVDDLPSENFLEELKAQSVPYVSLNRYDDAPGPWIALDDEAGFRAQAEYLIGLGHSRIAFVAGSPPSFVAETCLRAFYATLAAHGLSPALPNLTCGFDGTGVDEAADLLAAADERPTAVALASAQTAELLVEALERRGVSIPGDISVVGYHDSRSAEWSGITTVRMPSRDHGRMGALRLLDLICGHELSGQIVQGTPEIVERRSCRVVA